MPVGTWDAANCNPTIVLSSGNTVATRTNTPNNEHASVLGLIGRSTGKWYWEALCTGTTSGGTAQLMAFGAAKKPALLTASQFWNANGWGYWGNGGSKYHNSIAGGYGASFGDGDVISGAWDADNGRLFFGKNGTWQNSGDPVAGTNPAYSSVTGTLYPVVSMYTNSSHVWTLRCLASAQTGTPPTGFAALASAGTVAISLVHPDGSPVASTSVDWAFFEQATATTLELPIATGTASTDAGGVLSVAIPSTSMQHGDVGAMLVSTTAGSASAQCKSHFAPVAISIP